MKTTPSHHRAWPPTHRGKWWIRNIETTCAIATAERHSIAPAARARAASAISPFGLDPVTLSAHGLDDRGAQLAPQPRDEHLTRGGIAVASGA